MPGDVVLVEAGNRMPADGRICVAATLEIEEAALTGESLPVGKSTAPVPGDDVPLGDRTCMAYMNTAVTRGRGEMIVTATGMDTEIGHIADLLANTETDKTPLQKQLDGLSKIIAVIAGIALVFVVVLGLLRGESFDTLFITGVALAVAAIPTGLPAVVTALLSMGTREIARRNAIVKRLPAVETLGSTSAICSDKTGTLTLEQDDRPGAGDPRPQPVHRHGRGLRHHRRDQARRRVAHRPRSLPAADGPVRGRRARRREPHRRPDRGRARSCWGPRAASTSTRRGATFPRIAEVPFDSEYKFMATFHEMTGTDGAPVVRCYVKGAPDVLIDRGRSYRSPDGALVPVTDENRHLALDANDRMADSGQRVMVVAQRDFDPATFRAGRRT